ncbi:aminopeptidase P family protein [Candidatus Woesearchaeota archaeon]|nr:aminopeptidase P family protein [Candidatus Woesearchaeota archaeon]
MWDDKQIKQHRQAARLLYDIVGEAFGLLRNKEGISEYEVQQFILSRFAENDLITDNDPPIVAFNENSAQPHYYPPCNNSKRIEDKTLVMIDVWARLNEYRAPFADITWMAYKGRVPKRVQDAFDAVIKTRDDSIRLIRESLQKGRRPIARTLDVRAVDFLIKAGYQNFHHGHTFGLGHSIGLSSPHGDGPFIEPDNWRALLANYGYTIEPAVYITNGFGVRSEIDVLITRKKELLITTEVQKELVRL